MYNCHKEITKFHDDEVNLNLSQQDSMRNKRNANRRKLENGLRENASPKYVKVKSQGSYAMRTMVQAPNNDYDIDDGVYFKRSDLVGSGGADKAALAVRQMVCDAVQDSSLKKTPYVRKHCVRVEYNDGTHIDIPAYRLDDNEENPELASTDWVRSDAQDVTEWFKDQRRSCADGDQLLRLVRLVKAFARSRESWKGSILGGFGITVLVCECYSSYSGRDDAALYYTLQKMCNRLRVTLQIEHPVTHGTFIADYDDSKAKKFRDELCEKFEELAKLFDDDCEEAMKCWNKFFNTDFFDGRCDNGKKYSATSPTPVNKQGSNRFA